MKQWKISLTVILKIKAAILKMGKKFALAGIDFIMREV